MHTHTCTHKHTHTCTHTHKHTIFLERSPRDACSLQRGADRAHKLRLGGKSHIPTHTQTHTHKHMHARMHTHAYTRTHNFFRTLASRCLCSAAWGWEHSRATSTRRKPAHKHTHTHIHTHTQKHSQTHTHACTHTYIHTIFLERSPRDACALRRGAESAHKPLLRQDLARARAGTTGRARLVLGCGRAVFDFDSSRPGIFF